MWYSLYLTQTEPAANQRTLLYFLSMTTDVWALVRGDNERALEEYLEGCEGEGHKLEEVSRQLDKATAESKRRCTELEKAILLEAQNFKVEILARQLSVERHIHALVITRNAKYFNKRFPTSSSGRSLRADYFEQKRLREKERQALTSNRTPKVEEKPERPQSLEKLGPVKEPPPLTLLQRIKKAKMSGQLPAHDPPPVPAGDASPTTIQPPSLAYHEFREQVEVGKMVDRVNSGAYREQRVPSILQEDTVGEQTEHDQPVSHIRQIHHEATKSPSIQSTDTSSSHEKPKTKITSKVRSAILSTAKKLTRGRSGSSGSGGSRRSTQEIHIISQADAHPGDPDNIENRLQETLVLDVPPPVELHRSRELEETHSSSSTGLILQTEVSATVHVHRQSDQIHLEHHQGVDHLQGVELRREHDHYDPYKDSDEMYEQYTAPKGVLGTGQGASVSFGKDEKFEQYNAHKTIVGVGASPTSGGIGHGASITVGKTEVLEHHSGQKNIIGIGASPATERILVGHGASVTLSATPEKPHVFEQYSPPTNIVGLGASPTGTLPIIGQGATRTGSSPKPYDRYTPTSYSPSTKSPTFKVPPIPTEATEPYNPYADVVLKKGDDQKSPHYNAYGADAEIAAASQRHLISPEPQLDESGYAIPERALSPPPDAPPTEKKWTWRGTTTSASSRSRTPTDYEVADYMMETARLDDARIEYRAVDDTPRISERVLSPVEMERVLSPVLSREHELQTKLHYDDDLSEKLRKSLQEAERSLVQPKERAVDVQHRKFEASSSVSSTDFVQEVMSRRSFNLDGAPHRAVPSTVTPPSTPLTATITSTVNPLAAYARQESHLETHDEHAEYDEVTVERVQQQKMEPIYSEVANTHSPAKPKPIFKPKTEPTEQGRSQLLEEIRNRKWKPEPVVLTNYTVHTEPSRPTKPVPAPRNHEYDEVAREEPVRQASHREVFGHSQLSGTYTSTVETHLGEENIYEEIDHYQIVPAQQNSATSQKTSAAPPPPPTSAPPPRDMHRAREEFAQRHDSSAERKFKGNKYEDEPAPEPTEDEHLDWELIYTTNAIRQMSRNNKWRESMLNKDKIPPVPKKTKELPADVLPKNSPFTRPAESPSSGRKTPTSWTKNEGFTFSVPGIQRIAVEDEMEEERSKRAAPEAWEHERVGVKQVPTNIARGHQITVPRVAQPKEVVEPQPVDRQPTHQAPVAPRRATTEESYHFQGVKNLRQQFSSPEPTPWRRTQSVGNVYEVPRARLEKTDDVRTRPGPLSEVPKGRPSSTSSLLDKATPSTPIKQPARTHQDTPRVVRKEVTSPLPRIQSPRPRPVDLSPLTADAQQRFYTLRSPSPRAQTTPSPLARSEAELRIGDGAQPDQHFHSKPSERDEHEVRHQEHHPEKENHYEEIEHREVVGKPEVQHQKPVEHHYDEPAKENGHHPHGPDYSPYPHHYEHTYEPHVPYGLPHHGHHYIQHHHEDGRRRHGENREDRRYVHYGHHHIQYHHREQVQDHHHEKPQPHYDPYHTKTRDGDRFVLLEASNLPSVSPAPPTNPPSDTKRKPKQPPILPAEEPEPEFVRTQRELYRKIEENRKTAEQLTKQEAEQRKADRALAEQEDRRREEERRRADIERRMREEAEEEERVRRKREMERERLEEEDRERRRRDEERRKREEEEAREEEERKRRQMEIKEKEQEVRRLELERLRAIETEKENRRRAEEREKRRRAEEEEEEQRRQDVERREEDDRLWQLEQERKYEEEMRRKREGRLHSPTYRDADISRTEEHIYDQVYEPLERPERMERIEETRTQQRQHGGYHLEHYEDEEIEKTVIPVYGGHLVHDGRDMTVFPIATAHHYDEVHYQLAPEQRPPGIPEHIDLTNAAEATEHHLKNAEEVTVETKTKVVTIVKRRNVTGEIFEEEYLTENSTFPTSVHLTTPIHRLYDSNTPTSHYHTPAGDQVHLQRAGATLGRGASPIYDTVYEGTKGIGSGALPNASNSAPPPPEELVEKRDQPQYRSVGTSHSPPHQDAPGSPTGTYFDRNGELRRSWPVKTYDGSHLELGSHKYRLKTMPDHDSGLGSGERPSPERNGDETAALRDWDPKAMLDALYEISYERRAETKRDRFVNMQGHVEVPSDETATVAELERNWKEEYMRTKDGRLQTFVTHYAGEAPVQDVSLHGVEIEANREERTLHIHGGKEHIKILLRIKKCDTAETFDKWRQALLSHAAASNLDQFVTPVRRALPHISKRIVILELGSTSIRAGVLYQKPLLPQVFFPAIGCILDNGQIVVGNQAYEPENRQRGELVRPIQCDPSVERYSMDKEVTKACIERAIRDLGVDPREHHVLLSLPQNIPTSVIGDLLHTLLQQFHFKAAGITRQPSLILYAYDVTTGVVVDIGDRLNIVPVIDGYMVESAVVSIPMGAQQIRDSLRTSLASHNNGLFSFQTPCERLILRYVMEHSAYVPENYETESGEKKSISLTPFKPTSSMPREFEIDSSRFTCTEGLFRPKKWQLESKGIHHLIHDAVTQSPIDSRRNLYKNIYLAGGASLLPGLAEKVETELETVLPNTINAQVHISPWRYHAAFLGAQVVAAGASFEDSCIGPQQLQQFLTQLQATGF